MIKGRVLKMGTIIPVMYSSVKINSQIVTKLSAKLWRELATFTFAKDVAFAELPKEVKSNPKLNIICAISKNTEFGIGELSALKKLKQPLAYGQDTLMIPLLFFLYQKSVI